MRPSMYLAGLLVLGIAIGTSSGQDRVPPENAAAATNLQVRYADARLRLAEADLEIKLEMNRRIAGIVSTMEIERLKSNIAIAQRQLELAREYTHGSALSTQLNAAEAAYKLARLNLETAFEVNRKSPGTVSDSMIRRIKIKKEMAEIRVELWKDPAYIPSLIDEMQWQIDRLTDQVVGLSQRLDSLASP